PLEGTGGQEQGAARGESSGQGAQREQRDPGQEGATPAEQVTRAGPQQEEAAEGEDVRIEHPRQRRVREVQAALDVGERDIDDGGVEDDHQLGGQNDGQYNRRMSAPPHGGAREIRY